MGLLDGKVAIVTGTGPNIGGEIARTLAAEGARVVCVDRDLERAEAAAIQIREEGGNALAVGCDITDPDEAPRAVREAVDAYGRVDILVNNAAITHRETILDASFEVWQRVLGVILNGSFLMSQSAANQMVSQGEGGAIVNIASTSGHLGTKAGIAYATAKAGILNFSRSMALQLADHNIRVNSVTPTQTGIPVAGGRSRWEGPSSHEHTPRPVGQAQRPGAGSPVSRLSQRGLHHRNGPEGGRRRHRRASRGVGGRTSATAGSPAPPGLSNVLAPAFAE